MMSSNVGIFSITLDFVGGVPRIQKMIEALGVLGEIDLTSTIYKKYRTMRAEDLNSSFVLVLKIKLGVPAEDVFRKLDEISNSFSFKEQEEIVFLAVENQIRLVPGENLPNPLLHSDALILRCAAEVFGDYLHPVLGQTLSELVLCSDPTNFAEFFSQGQHFRQRSME